MGRSLEHEVKGVLRPRQELNGNMLDIHQRRVHYIFHRFLSSPALLQLWPSHTEDFTLPLPSTLLHLSEAESLRTSREGLQRDLLIGIGWWSDRLETSNDIFNALTNNRKVIKSRRIFPYYYTVSCKIRKTTISSKTLMLKAFRYISDLISFHHNPFVLSMTLTVSYGGSRTTLANKRCMVDPSRFATMNSREILPRRKKEELGYGNGSHLLSGKWSYELDGKQVVDS
ncbi:hypothetical protein L218DRAFT_240546 [Marasmius fiardii PR-910]|nr:hypothetical protein L218DRAFT_240546 [Marasmius fiardii PR-910]